MGGTVILPQAGHLTEFGTDPVTHVEYRGTCGQTALEVCLAAAQGRAPTLDGMMAITRDMIEKHRCAANGAATLAALAAEARDLGGAAIVALEWDYRTDHLAGDWVAILRAHAGTQPILIQVANGRALVDAETGKGDESGLHYHAIAIVGKQDDGYLVADGDNPQVPERFQVYNLQALADASPCGLLLFSVLHPPVALHVPAGWSDNGTTLTANGEQVTAQIRDFVLLFPGGWDAADVPIEGAVTEGAVTHQTFTYSRVEARQMADGQWETERVALGTAYVALAAQAQAITRDIADMRAAAQAAQEALSKLLAVK
jgi:hypothetical protein